MPPTGLMARRGRGLRALSVRSAGAATWWRAGYRYSPALAVPLILTLLIGWPSTVLKGGSMILEFTAIGSIPRGRSEEHTSELQSLMRTSYAVFGWEKKTKQHK